MRKRLVHYPMLLLLSGVVAHPLSAQIVPPQTILPDTTHKFENPNAVAAISKKPWYAGKLVKATIVPAVLIGYGAYTFNGGGF